VLYRIPVPQDRSAPFFVHVALPFMPAICEPMSSVVHAVKRFLYSKNKIRGTGEFVLLFKCTRPWTAYLYPTAEQRDAAWVKYQFSSCPALNCL
jgi:hypothetical protein